MTLTLGTGLIEGRAHLKTLPQLLKSLRLYNSYGKDLKESELVSFVISERKSVMQ